MADFDIGVNPKLVPDKPPQSSIEENSSTKDLNLDISSEVEKKLIDHIDLSWRGSDAARMIWKKDKEEGLEAYWGLRRPKDFPFKNSANLHVPLTRTIKDTLHANIMASIDEQSPASIVPVGPEDVPKAVKVEKLLNWQFNSQVDYEDLVYKIVDSTLIFGYAAVKVRYVVDRSSNEKTFDGLKVDVLPPERFLFPPDASDDNIDDWDYCIQEIPMSKSDLRKRMASGQYRKIDLTYTPTNTTRQTTAGTRGIDLLENIRSVYSGIDSTNISFKDKNFITVLEWYGGFDIDNDGIDESILVVTLLETRQILKIMRWEGPRPFKMVRFSPILNKPTGESVPDLLVRMNQELNTIHNQRVDAVTFNNIPFFFFDPLSGFNPSEIHLTPGLGIPVNGSPSQAVYFPQYQRQLPDMYREEDLIGVMAERLLGAGANIQGVQNPREITATEVSSIDRRSGIRFSTIFNRIRKGIKGILQLALYLDQKYMPPEVQVRILGIDDGPVLFETVTKDDILGNFDILINGDSIIDAQAARNQQLQMYQIGITSPLIASDPISMYRLTRDTFNVLGAKNVDDYIKPPQDTLPKTPQEEHNLFLQEEEVRPSLADNFQQHISEHGSFINSKNFDLLSKKGKKVAIKHYSITIEMYKKIQMMQKIAEIQQVNSQLMQLHTGTHPLQQLPQQGGQNGAQPQGVGPQPGQ